MNQEAHAATDSWSQGTAHSAVATDYSRRFAVPACSALTVHAAVLNANDRHDDARSKIQQATLEKLLPEVAWIFAYASSAATGRCCFSRASATKNYEHLLHPILHVENRKDRANDLYNAGRDDGVSERHAKNASVLEFLEKILIPTSVPHSA